MITLEKLQKVWDKLKTEHFVSVEERMKKIEKLLKCKLKYKIERFYSKYYTAGWQETRNRFYIQRPTKVKFSYKIVIYKS